MILPFCSHPVCLPVLSRLWAGRGTSSPVALAGQLLHLLGSEFSDRMLHAWSPAEVQAYGHTATALLAVVPAIWYGAFGNTPGRVVLAAEPGAAKAYDLALFTTDLDTAPEAIVARYADRWSIETAIATGKQALGVGQARNRVAWAVQRTVPFGFIVQSLVIIWYATAGYHPEDLTARQAAEPWYGQKSEPAFEDMLAKLRRTIIAARLTPPAGNPPDPEIIRDYTRACAAAAA